MTTTSRSSIAQALSARMFLAALATQESMAAYIGAKLGLYEALRDHGPATVDELAQRTGVSLRYLREWLEQQAVCGLLAVSDPFGSADSRVYSLPPGHEAVLTASDDPLSVVSRSLLPLGGVAAALPHLLDAFRTGQGVGDERFGDDWRQGHGGANRAVYTHQLADWLLLHAPAAHEALSAGGKAVDIGAGAGWASIAIAAAYPRACVIGFDIDGQSVREAAHRAEDAGVGDRVKFEVANAAALSESLNGTIDVVCVFDTLHELSDPVGVLSACRLLRARDGSVLVLDAKVAEGFVAPGDEIERFQYATSVLHCLPVGLSGTDSHAAGTVMRPAQVRAMARAAGFAQARHVDLDDRFHRLYTLLG